MARGVQLVRIGKRYFEYTLFFAKKQRFIKAQQGLHKLFLKCLVQSEGIKGRGILLIRNAGETKAIANCSKLMFHFCDGA
jgi:hypothetical protein